MNRAQLSAIMQIVKKLGWNDMPATTALDAIKTITNNYISGLADCTEEVISIDSALDLISNYLEADDIYLCLFIYDYHTLNDESMHKYALSLRHEIEASMKNGELFDEARREWDI